MFACVRVRVCDGVFACVRVQDDSCGGQNLLRFRVVFQGIAFSGRCPPAMLTCQHNAMGGFHNRGRAVVLNECLQRVALRLPRPHAAFICF